MSKGSEVRREPAAVCSTDWKRLRPLSQREEVGSWSPRSQQALLPAHVLLCPSPLAGLPSTAPGPPLPPSPPSPSPLLQEASPDPPSTADFLPRTLHPVQPVGPLTTGWTAPTGQMKTLRPGRVPGWPKLTPPAGVGQVRHRRPPLRTSHKAFSGWVPALVLGLAGAPGPPPCALPSMSSGPWLGPWGFLPLPAPPPPAVSATAGYFPVSPPRPSRPFSLLKEEPAPSSPHPLGSRPTSWLGLAGTFQGENSLTPFCVPIALSLAGPVTASL